MTSDVFKAKGSPAGVGREAVYQIENDPEEWFDVDRASYEGHDGSRKRILYTAPPSAPVGVADVMHPEAPTMTTDVELLPCPGCGGQNVRVIGGSGTRGGPQYWAGCDYCPWRTWGNTEAEAVAAWNSRATAAKENDDA